MHLPDGQGVLMVTPDDEAGPGEQAVWYLEPYDLTAPSDFYDGGDK